MKPGKPAEKFFIKQGDTFRLFFRARKKLPDGTPGAYYVFTGMFPLAQLRSSTGALLATFECTLADQTEFPGGIYVRLGPVTTAGLTAAVNHKMDVQVSSVNPAGTITDAAEVDTFLENDVEVSADVTELP